MHTHKHVHSHGHTQVHIYSDTHAHVIHSRVQTVYHCQMLQVYTHNPEDAFGIGVCFVCSLKGFSVWETTMCKMIL